MGELQFNFYFCGMSEETFSEDIMIYKPSRSIVRAFTEASLRQHGLETVGGLIGFLKKDEYIRENLGSWGLENFAVGTVYVQHQGCLLGFKKDKPISEVFKDLNADRLEFAYFIVGGASFHNETNYRFTIHPDEKIHEHMPHVHVSKADVEIRYSLETLLPIDPLEYPHKRDNKKVIIPFLRRNRERFMQYWDYYSKGYTTPETTQDGRQFYPES